DITDDVTVGRLLQAFMSLPPDEREIVASVLERGAAWRRIAETAAGMTGVQLRANPNARLFLRVLEPHDPAAEIESEPPEILIGPLRIMKQAPLPRRPEIARFWHTATLQAFEMLEPGERESCVAFLRDVLALLAGPVAEDGATLPL